MIIFTGWGDRTERSARVNSSYIAKKLADYPDIHTGGVISFPGGGDTIFQKSRQAKELREAGCKELDMVMNLTALRSHEDNYVLEDIGAVREAAGKDILKVIIEAPQLTEEEIRRAVNLCIRAGADYAKQAQAGILHTLLPSLRYRS